MLPQHKEPVSLAGSAAMISGIKLSNFKMQELISNSTIAIPLSLATANQKEITRHKIAHVISKFQKQEADTGSASVQIAVMTEKILCLARHFNVHRKDHASARGFQSLISRRKRMLAYLKRSNFEKFKETVTALGLRKEAIDIK